MASKRQKKKQNKKALIERFKAPEKTTYKELTKRAEKADKQKARREQKKRENEAYIKSKGYNFSVSQTATKAQIDEKIKALKQEQKAKAKAERERLKIEMLTKAGFTQEQAYKNRNKSYSKISEIISGGVYKSEAWLSLCWWDRTGETNLMSALEKAQNLSLDEKIRLIHEMYENADEDNSDSLQGIARMAHAETKQQAEQAINLYKLRGYGNKVPFNFAKLSLSNEFTAAGVTDILYVVMSNTSGLEQKNIYENMRNFFEINVPEIYNRIF